jgi:hypothetical protein
MSSFGVGSELRKLRFLGSLACNTRNFGRQLLAFCSEFNTMSLFGVGQDGLVLRLAGVFTGGIVVNVSIVLDRLLVFCEDQHRKRQVKGD